LAKRTDKKIHFYNHKKYSLEAELMQLVERFNSIPKSALSLDKGKTNHMHRIKVKIDKIQKEIKSYEIKIEELQAM
jgi:hypothetical protein